MLQMLTSFFVASKGKKIEKIEENVKIEEVKIHIFRPRNLINFNETFGKTATYYDIKSD